MKSKNHIIVFLIGIIAILIIVMLARENQHLTRVENYLEAEIREEKSRLETYKEFVKDYNEFQASYNELYEKYQSLCINWSSFTVTAYTQYDEGCNNLTAIGLDLNKDWTRYFNFCAVDPNVIPYGTTVFIKLDGEIISALAVDTGGAIVGNHIDFYCDPSEVSKIGSRKDVPVGVIK